MITMRLQEAARCLGATVAGSDVTFRGCSTDSRKISPGNLFIALRGSHFDGGEFVGAAAHAGASAAMVERAPENSSLPLLLVNDARLAMGRLAADWRGRFAIPLVAVTGSNGKTTVKEMVSAVLSLEAPTVATRGNLNNDIGVPLTLFMIGDEHRYAVVEMGANHAGEISGLSRMAHPTVAVITLCAPAHLEGFGSIEGVANAKAEIYEGLSRNGIAVINSDDPFAALWRERSSRFNQITFGLNSNAQVRAESLESSPGTANCAFDLNACGKSVHVNLPVPGRHNVMNALAAASCCLALGIDLDVIRAGLERMHGVKGRLQQVRGVNGSRILDDTYNANPSSLQAALEVLTSLPGRHWLVLGDMGELGPSAATLHADIGSVARSGGLERIYTLGELSRHAAQTFGAGARHYENIESLCTDLRSELTPEVAVLVKGSRAMAMERVIQSVGAEI